MPTTRLNSALLVFGASLAVACGSGTISPQAREDAAVSQEPQEPDAGVEPDAGESPCATPTLVFFPVRAAHNTGWDTTADDTSLWTCGSDYSNSDFDSSGSLPPGTGIWAAQGAPVLATVDGTLSWVESSSERGNTLTLTDGCGFAHVYAFLDGYGKGIAADSIGASVTAGQIIGYVGSTGSAAKGVAHLQYSLLPDGDAEQALDPWPYLRAVETSVCDAPTCPSGSSAFWTCDPATLELTRCIDGVVEKRSCADGCEAKPAGTDATCKPAPCPAGTSDKWSCDATAKQLTRCVNGAVEKKACAYGCDVKPAGTDAVCKPPPCPAGITAKWSCNATTKQLTRCIDGVVEKKSCSYGCDVKPAGTDAVCKPAPPTCPAGTYPLWNCNTATGQLTRCINGVVSKQACSYGCEVKPTGTNDVCKPKPAKKVLSYVWQRQSTGYWCGPASTRIALSTRMANPPSQATLASYMGTTVNGTDSILQVRDALNHYLGSTWFQAKFINDPPTAAQASLLKTDLVTNIDAGYPMVANIVSGWRPPFYPGGTIYHYIAIVGYDQSGAMVAIADPAGEGTCCGWENVPRVYWIKTSNLAVWIGGKGYAA